MLSDLDRIKDGMTVHPKIVILTTGGTIAMRHLASADGAVPQLTGDDFLSALPPHFFDQVALTVDAVCNLPSSHFTLDTLCTICQRARQWLSRTDVAGVVITHGTDTLEETAYLCDLIVPGAKPVVLTGAMRTVSDVGYEGYANLVAAVRVAADPAARGLGALVVMNDQIHAARFVTKMHTLNPATFQSPEFGPLGRITGERVEIVQRVSRDLVECDVLEPDVALLKLGVGMAPTLLDCVLQHGAKGVVLEALGGGRVPHWWLPAIREAVEAGVVVMIASRCPAGPIWDGYGYAGAYASLKKLGVLFAPGINGPKARIRLMCALGHRS